MSHGKKSNGSGRQKRQTRPIEESDEDRGLDRREASRRTRAGFDPLNVGGHRASRHRFDDEADPD